MDIMLAKAVVLKLLVALTVKLNKKAQQKRCDFKKNENLYVCCFILDCF